MKRGKSHFENYIQILWHGFYPWDVRLEKFIKIIHRMGLNVGVIGRNVDAAPNFENIENVKIQRIGKCGSIFSKAFNYPLFCNPVFILKVAKLLRENKPSLLLVRDLPLGLLALCLGRLLKIPVVLDMAENYPAALIAYENPIYKPFLFSNAFLPRMYEKIVARRVDAVLVVAKEQAKRLNMFGVREERIHLVQNTPERDFIENKYNLNDVTNTVFEPMILYIGKIDIHRGIKTMIEALPEILVTLPKAGLVLVGDGKEKKALEKLTHKMGLRDKVIFAGWRDHKQLPGFIKQAHVCCIPHLKSEHTDTTIPNKLYDYMAFGKNLLVSNLDPVQRIVKQVNCGTVFLSGSPKSFAAEMLRLIELNKSDQLGLRGIDAIMDEYNWDNDAGRLEQVLHGLIPIYRAS